MKVAVIGSRSFADCSKVTMVLDELTEITHIISGGAKGADNCAEDYAKKHGLPITIFYPNWERYGRSGGIIRNKEIIASCDMCVVFWDGKSKGTANSLEVAKKLGKEIKLIRFNTEVEEG
ncbi:MAG: DUF2493 domain-containing protein [Candidatus Cloacimonadales bacterium]